MEGSTLVMGVHQRFCPFSLLTDRLRQCSQSVTFSIGFFWLTTTTCWDPSKSEATEKGSGSTLHGVTCRLRLGGASPWREPPLLRNDGPHLRGASNVNKLQIHSSLPGRRYLLLLLIRPA